MSNIRLLSTLSLSALAVAQIPYTTVTLDCLANEQQGYIVTPGQDPVLKYIAIADGQITQCKATPDGAWPSKETDTFSELNVAVTNDGSTTNVNNPGAVFSFFTFDVELGAATGPQELTADKDIAPWSFVTYSEQLIKYSLECGPGDYAVGDVLTCTVTSQESNDSPRFVRKQNAEPNVAVAGGGAATTWDDWKIEGKPVIGSSFEFTLTLLEPKQYFITLGTQPAIEILVIDVPDATTVIECDQNFTNPGTQEAPQDDSVTCTITPNKDSENILVDPDTVRPSATGLNIVEVGDWEKPDMLFRFSLTATAGQKSGIYDITIGEVGDEIIVVLGEPNNSTSTCVCDATDIFIGSSVLCTSMAKDTEGDPVFFDINRYLPASTSNREGIASGFSAGYLMDITSRNKDDGHPTIGSEFVFQFKAEDRGFEERKVKDQFASQTAAEAECEQGDNSVATLCQQGDLQYVLDKHYIKKTTGWGWSAASTTDVYKIDFEQDTIDNQTFPGNLSNAFCCAAVGTLDNKDIKIVDGVSSQFPMLKVLVATDPNATVTAGELSLDCETPVALGSTSVCTFFAGSQGKKIAIVGDRLMFNGSPLDEAGNVRNVFVIPFTPDAAGTIEVNLTVSNPKDGSSVSKKFDIVVEGETTTPSSGGQTTDYPQTFPATTDEPQTGMVSTDYPQTFPATTDEPQTGTTSGPTGNTTGEASSAFSTVSTYGAFALLLQCLLLWA